MDLETIAEHLDLKIFLMDVLNFSSITRVSNDIRIRCPNPTHYDSKSSCFINVNNLVFHCFGCGEKGTIVTLTADMLGISKKNALRKIMEFADIDVENPMSGRVIRTEEIPDVDLSYHFRRDWENADKDILNYVRQRKFNLSLFNRFKIGYNQNLKSITLPIIHHKKIINIGERFINPNDPSMKILYKKDVPLAHCIWGIQDGFSPINPYFTEGIFDAIRLIEAGFNAFAILSNQLPDIKLSIIQRLFPNQTYTIVPDNDDGGTKMIKNWQKALGVTNVYIMPIHDFKDADETPIHILREYERCKFRLGRIGN